MSDETAAQLTPDPNYADVPDLSGLTQDRPDPWENGWYSATALANRTFTQRDTGNTITFESKDDLANKSGRNIAVQIQVKRKNGDLFNGRVLVNYLPEFLTSTVIAQVTQHKQAMKDAKAAGQKPPEWGPLFRAFSALADLGTLQRIAGVRQFARNGNGGLDISPLFGRTLYVRLGPDEQKPQYKSVVEFSDVLGKKAVLL